MDDLLVRQEVSEGVAHAELLFELGVPTSVATSAECARVNSLALVIGVLLFAGAKELERAEAFGEAHGEMDVESGGCLSEVVSGAESLVLDGWMKERERKRACADGGDVM